MLTLSLLKNVDELLTLKLKKLPVPDGILNPDIEWFANEYNKWSKQYSFRSPYVDKTLIEWACRMPVPITQSATTSTKQRLLNYLKAVEIMIYMDAYLKTARAEKSEEKARDVVQQLLDALRTGQSDTDIGKMRIDGISDMKREMNGDQWLRFQTELEKCLIIHLEVHCDYYLKNRFIEFDKYQEKRIYESFWICIVYGVEYLFEFPTPEGLESSVQTYVQKCIELCLAVDDHYLTISKIMTNDITARPISYAHHHKCSIGEALDIHFEYTIQLYNECKELMDQLISSGQGGDLFKEYLRGLLACSGTVYSIIAITEHYETNPDQTVQSKRWQQMYKDIVNNRAQTIPWDI